MKHLITILAIITAAFVGVTSNKLQAQPTQATKSFLIIRERSEPTTIIDEVQGIVYIPIIYKSIAGRVTTYYSSIDAFLNHSDNRTKAAKRTLNYKGFFMGSFSPVADFDFGTYASRLHDDILHYMHDWVCSSDWGYSYNEIENTNGIDYINIFTTNPTDYSTITNFQCTIY